MDLTRSTPSTPSAAANAAQSVPPLETNVRNTAQNDVRNEIRSEVRNDLRNAVRHDAKSQQSLGFGLPCSNCRLYYPANLDACPACNSRVRVSPRAVPAIPKAQVAAESSPDSAFVEREREAFLKELESKISATPEEVASSIAICNLENHRAQDDEPASICQACYARLQERVDVFEAALHMDLKEAAQIIYDAVWADPSDPGKTYTNAASALLSELRKRSGVSSVLGPFHPRGN
ncbi:MAG: hypothetical protein WA811_16900 [Candidatus Sulfotelmatobacter sp.]